MCLSLTVADPEPLWDGGGGRGQQPSKHLDSSAIFLDRLVQAEGAWLLASARSAIKILNYIA